MGSLVNRGLSAAATAFSARPAVSMTYEIAGRFLSIESNEGLQPAGLDQLLARFYLTPAESSEVVAPDAIIKFSREKNLDPISSDLECFEVPGGHCHTDGQLFVFDFDSGRVVVQPYPSRLTEIVMNRKMNLTRSQDAQIFNYAISAALRRCDFYELHSAAVLEPETRRGILLVGPSGSGKSTITLQLAAAGWPYLTDDILLLTEGTENVEARPLRRAFAVTAASVSASGHSALAESMSRFEDFGESKKRFAPQDFFPSGFASSCVPGAIYFPTVTDNPTTEVRALSQGETMIRLVRISPWASYHRSLGREHLRALATLTRQCKSYELSAGRDMLTDASLLPRLLSRDLAVESNRG